MGPLAGRVPGWAGLALPDGRLIGLVGLALPDAGLIGLVGLVTLRLGGLGSLLSGGKTLDLGEDLGNGGNLNLGD